MWDFGIWGLGFSVSGFGFSAVLRQGLNHKGLLLGFKIYPKGPCTPIVHT